MAQADFMAGNAKYGSLVLTPHKVSVCVLISIYAPPSQSAIPFPFSCISQHNRLGLFLLAATKSYEDFLEPSLGELTNQLAAADGLLYDWLGRHLTSQLTSLSSPDDLYNFFNQLRNVLASPEIGSADDQIFLDPSSLLGMFLRRCILTFNLLSFEGMCHLLTNIKIYCKENDIEYGLHEIAIDKGGENLEEDADLESNKYEAAKYSAMSAEDGFPFHIHTPGPISRIVEDVQFSADSKFKNVDDGPQLNDVEDLPNDSQSGLFLRSKSQVQGYMKEQADVVEQHGSSFPLNTFETILKQLEKLAPELHYAHYLRYLNSLYHDDYLSALENIHCYFDYSAGVVGISSEPSSFGDSCLGRDETALLCLGMMHTHFGHSRQALQVLCEGVQISQQNNNDRCLAYILSAFCELFSEVQISHANEKVASVYGPGTTMNIGATSSAPQQLLVLLKRSLQRAESLKLTHLVAFNRLALAKFYLKHVRRPMICFGPKAPSKLCTSPASVCKELRLSCYLLSGSGLDSTLQSLDGAFSTTWLKNLQSARVAGIMLNENVTGNDYDTFHFSAQPNPVPGSLLRLAGASYLLRATSWEHHGSAPLVRLNAVAYVTCYGDTGSSTDLSLAYVKLVQHLAVYKGYKEAFTALKLAEEKFLSVSKSRIQMLKLQVLHEHALHCGQLKLAQHLCNEFGTLASSVTGMDVELKIEASLRYARTLLAARQYSQAAAVAHSLFCMCHKFDLQVEKATVLLLLAEIYLKSGNAILGLPYTLASLSFCQSFNLDLLEASATLMIAEVWLAIGSNHANRALTFLNQKFSIILGHGGLELRARANIAVAKCYLSDPHFSSKVTEDPDLVLNPLKEAAQDLEALEFHVLAAEAYYLMAIIFNELRLFREREAAASSFKAHVIALEKSADPSFMH